MFELTEIMRQKDDYIFVAALNRLREGEQTAADVKLFKTRITTREHDLTSMFVVNNPRDTFNHKIIRRHQGALFEFRAIDTLSSDDRTDIAVQKARDQIAVMPPKKTQKLLHDLIVKEGLPVKLSSKVDVKMACAMGLREKCALSRARVARLSCRLELKIRLSASV